MATELEGIKMARPMTHDLLRSMHRRARRHRRVHRGHRSTENTYFALIYLDVGDRHVTIDSRPSDAISLALRTKSPIYVAKPVLEALERAAADGRGQGSEPVQRFARQVGRDSREDVARRLQVQDVTRAAVHLTARPRKPMAKGIRRKELKEPDEFLTLSKRFVDYAREHERKLTGAVLAVVRHRHVSAGRSLVPRVAVRQSRGGVRRG